jgi:hypothetical protein
MLTSLEVTDVEVAAPPEDGDLGISAPKRKRPVWRVVQILLAVAVVAISFLYAIPKIANYSEVWTEIRDMTPARALVPVRGDGPEPRHLLVGEHGVDPEPRACGRPRSTTRRRRRSRTRCRAGGYVSIAVSYEMYRAWGFSKTDVGLSVAVTSVLNIFAKLALPAIALLLIILSGRASGSLVGASIVGNPDPVRWPVALFGLVMWKKRFAKTIGIRPRAGGDVGRAPVSAARVRSTGATPRSIPAEHDRLPRGTLVLARRAPRSLSHLSAVSSCCCLALPASSGCSDRRGEPGRRCSACFAFGPAPSRRCPITPGGLGIVEVAVHRRADPRWPGSMRTCRPTSSHAQVTAGRASSSERSPTASRSRSARSPT